MTPSITKFNPKLIPYQIEVIRDIRQNFDYSKGVHEILLSGSVGSAKSILLAHIVATHCLLYPGARALIGRKTMPSLKDTLLKMIIEHLDSDVSYSYNKTRGSIEFSNGSEIISHSWSDGNYSKVRSYALSMAALEEITENETMDFYKEILMRVGRLPNIKECLVVSATNPASPSGEIYQYFMEKKSERRRVYYSITEDNPFLPRTYIENLKENLDPKEARRMLYGEWIELTQDVIYWNYSKAVNYKDTDYIFNEAYPVDLCFDFNIGLGKPMSAGSGQYINGTFHCARDYVVHGARTMDILEEMAADGVFDKFKTFRIFGDATGKSRDTRSIRSDYDIIKKFVENYDNKRRPVKMMVASANPPIRERHNTSNALFMNANNQSSVVVYKGAPVTDKGFRLSKLKKNGNYIEDDSDEYQHITTARTYWFHFIKKTERSAGRMVVLS